jgi:ATP-dependent RNA helicase RhlE
VDIIVATPGRLMDLMEQRIVDLSGIEIFVLDEADRMLDMGFIQPIRKIAATIKTASRQTLLFSATMPKEIVHLANSLLRDPVKIAVDPVSSAVPLIEQGLYMVPKNIKQSLLEHLLGDPTHKVTRALIFTRTKHGADKVGRKLWQVGIQAETIHGNKSQNQRKRALDRFTSGAARVLVATDVAARGLDVDDISHVINYDLPVEPEAYVHRIGRTGRAGAKGIALSFCDAEERGTLRDIERLTGKKIPVHTAPTGLSVAAPAPRAPYSAQGHSGHAAHAPRSHTSVVETELERRERKSRLQRNHGPGGAGAPPAGHKSRGHHEAPSSDRAHAPRPAHGSHPKPRHAADSQGSAKPSHPHGHSKPSASKSWHPKKTGHRQGSRR